MRNLKNKNKEEEAAAAAKQKEETATAAAAAAAAAAADEEERRVKVRLVQDAVCRSIWALGRVSLCARFALLSMGGGAGLGLQEEG